MLKHDDVQAALSARFDGESYALSDDVIDAHVANCPECASFRDNALALSRALNPQRTQTSFAPPKDLSEVILAGVEPEWRRTSQARQSALAIGRVLAAILGISFTIWAAALVVRASGLVPTVGNGEILGLQADPERALMLIEGAAWRLGLASGMFFVSWKPSNVSGMLPIACTMLAFLFGFTVRDLALGHGDAGQVYLLVAMFTATAVLSFIWAADKGYLLRRAWKDLGANPH